MINKDKRKLWEKQILMLELSEKDIRKGKLIFPGPA